MKARHIEIWQVANIYDFDVVHPPSLNAQVTMKRGESLSETTKPIGDDAEMPTPTHPTPVIDAETSKLIDASTDELLGDLEPEPEAGTEVVSGMGYDDGEAQSRRLEAAHNERERLAAEIVARQRATAVERRRAAAINPGSNRETKIAEGAENIAALLGEIPPDNGADDVSGIANREDANGETAAERKRRLEREYVERERLTAEHSQRRRAAGAAPVREQAAPTPTAPVFDDKTPVPATKAQVKAILDELWAELAAGDETEPDSKFDIMSKLTTPTPEDKDNVAVAKSKGIEAPIPAADDETEPEPDRELIATAPADGAAATCVRPLSAIVDCSERIEALLRERESSPEQGAIDCAISQWIDRRKELRDQEADRIVCDRLKTKAYATGKAPTPLHAELAKLKLKGKGALPYKKGVPVAWLVNKKGLPANYLPDDFASLPEKRREQLVYEAGAVAGIAKRLEHSNAKWEKKREKFIAKWNLPADYYELPDDEQQRLHDAARTRHSRAN